MSPKIVTKRMLRAVAGVTYRIAIDGWSGLSG
jgi:hypothetical protein